MSMPVTKDGFVFNEEENLDQDNRFISIYSDKVVSITNIKPGAY